MRQTCAEINLSALRENLKVLWNLNGRDRFFCPMVKADAYGHGAREVALELEHQQVPQVGVSLLEEAVALRENGFQNSIFVFGSFDTDVDVLFEHRLIPVLGNETQLRALQKYMTGKDLKLNCHFKINTGMNRLGFDPEQVERVLSQLNRIEGLHVEGVLTHLATPEDLHDQRGQSHQQLESFQKLLPLFEVDKKNIHVWSSLAMGSETQSETFGSRPGLAMYGYAPGSPLQKKLQPVMQFKSQIVALHKIKAGQSVSYGATWVATETTWIATVAAGYADGVSRALSNKAQVTVKGKKFSIRGRVCMDYFMIDLGLAEEAENYLGAEVLIFGDKDQGADLLAEVIGTATYEVLTQVSARVPRKVINV
jgi:alanine racemase